LAKYRRANPKKEGVNIWRSTDEQTPPKRKELIFEKYRWANPKKEGVDIWRSTDGKNPKKERVDI